MIYTLIAAILIVFLVTIGVYFVNTGHPWFALLMFLMAGGVSVKEIRGDTDGRGEGGG